MSDLVSRLSAIRKVHIVKVISIVLNNKAFLYIMEKSSITLP